MTNTRIGHLVEDAFTGTRVDREAGVIHGVKLLGEEAPTKGRRYGIDGMRAAVSLYEGKPVNIDHRKRGDREPRRVADRFGMIENARFDESKRGVFGDVRYNKGHPLAEQIAYAAEKLPRSIGSSHIAEGRVVGRPGSELIEAIVSVESVDFVSDPATTKGLFESEFPPESTVPSKRPNGARRMELSEATIATIESERPDLIRTLTESITKTLAESAEAKAKDAKIKALTEENDALKVEIASGKRAASIEKKLAEAKLPDFAVTDAFRAQLAEAKDDKALDALIEDRKAVASKAGKGTKPVSTHQKVEESKDDAGKGESKPVGGAVAWLKENRAA